MKRQSPVTVLAKITPGREEALAAWLSDYAGNPAGKASRFPYGDLPDVHFARWFIVPAAEVDGDLLPASVVYAANVDGTVAQHFEELEKNASAALDEIFSHCEKYPSAGQRTRDNRLQYLREHFVSTPAFYVGAPGRTVDQVHREAELQRAVSQFLNERPNETGASAFAALHAVRQRLLGDERWKDMAKPFHLPRPRWILLILFALLLLILIPFLVILAVLIHFFDERRLAPLGLDYNQVDADHIRKMKRQEDYIYQNQLTQVFVTKPGLRRLSLRFFLWSTNQLARLLYVKGSLLGTPTIHFARWFLIDGGKRFIFLSNFDGSYDEYLGDFVDNSGWGLNAIYGSSMGYPRTLLIFGKGAYLIGQFLGWGRYMQIPTQSWYSAYPNYGLPQIVNRSALRVGLFSRRALSEKKIRALMRRI